MKQLIFLTLLMVCLLEISCLVNQSVPTASSSKTNIDKEQKNQDSAKIINNKSKYQNNPIEVHNPNPVEAAPLLKGKKAFTPWQHTIGDFIISWKGNTLKNAQLSISSRLDTSKIYWTNLVGKSFILAADAEEKKGVGADKVLEMTNIICDGHSVERAGFKDNILTIVGFFNCSELENVKYSLTFITPDKGQLKFDLKVNHPSIGRTGLIFQSTSKEQIFGFGEQFGTFDFKGKRIPIYVDEQGLSRGIGEQFRQNLIANRVIQSLEKRQ